MLFVCLLACLLACLYVCLFACLFVWNPDKKELLLMKALENPHVWYQTEFPREEEACVCVYIYIYTHTFCCLVIPIVICLRGLSLNALRAHELTVPSA